MNKHVILSVLLAITAVNSYCSHSVLEYLYRCDQDYIERRKVYFARQREARLKKLQKVREELGLPQREPDKADIQQAEEKSKNKEKA